MSLSYDKIKERERSSEQMWPSASDLFMVLSLIFLLLYVTASLRSGTHSIQQQLEYQRLATVAEDLKEQNRVYNTLKDDYLESQASQSEQKLYLQLMDKLSLLKNDAKEEKEQLRKQAAENERKEIALNHYQRIVRNIINANMLAKAGLQQRDAIIAAKRRTIADAKKLVANQEQTIASKQKEIERQSNTIAKAERQLQIKSDAVDQLQKTVTDKTNQIESNTQQIAKIESRLKKRIKDLKKSKLSKKKLQQRVAKLRQKTDAQIEKLETQNKTFSSELTQTKLALTDANEQLSSAKSTIDKQIKEKNQLTDELEKTTASYASDMDQLKKQFQDDLAQQKIAFQNDMKAQKLGAAARAKKEREFRKKAKAQQAELGKKLANLGDKIKEAEKQLKQAKEQEKKHRDYIASLEKTKGDLADDLRKSESKARAKNKLVKQIKDSFKKAGLKIDIDSGSGDVVLTFGKEYFDTDKSSLKRNMKKTLRKFMPVYSKALFKDKKISKNIESVEIVGFSSPTYGGKYVDPQSLSTTDRQAVDYNLDLSYKRARSIFTYIFDRKKMKYTNQKKLLKLVKVTGRSYLAQGAKGKGLAAGMSRKEYCKKFDCLKEQRVIIRFNLKD